MDKHGYAVKRSFTQHPLFSGKRPLLSHLDIELTERCNNACMHCYINLPAQDLEAAQRELTTGQWKDILRQAADLGALSIRFTGGEPLLRGDFAELYLYTRRLGMQVMLFTNARLITPELAELFSRVLPLKKIEISVYGMRPESYDAVACAPGAFAEFRRGVVLLWEHQVPFVVKSVLLPPNRAELFEFETWAATIPWMDRIPVYSLFLDLRTRRDSCTRNRLIKSLRFSPQESVALLAQRESTNRNWLTEFCFRFMGPKGDQLFTCGAGESGCVDAYGRYQMCMLLRYPDAVYDLSKGSLRGALIEFFPRMRGLQASNLEYLNRCARCLLKGLCEQCPGKSWSEHGTLDTPVEYLCLVAHTQARYFGLLMDGEYGWEVENWQQRIESLGDLENAERITKSEF